MMSRRAPHRGTFARTSRRRHIRDIAHIYLSGSTKRKTARRCRLAIAGQSRELFPGLHVANIAAAFARLHTRVHIVEQSGLLPNASFYFSHPPETYYRGPESNGARVIAGMAGVSLSFAPVDGTSAGDDRMPVDIVHLPPLASGGFEKAIETVAAGGATSLIVLTEGAGNNEPSVLSHPEVRVFSLRVVRDGPAGATRRADDLGDVLGWQWTLTDRVPITIRRPQSPLSRSYTSACEGLMARLTQRGEPNDEYAKQRQGDRTHL